MSVVSQTHEPVQSPEEKPAHAGGGDRPCDPSKGKPYRFGDERFHDYAREAALMAQQQDGHK